VVARGNIYIDIYIDVRETTFGHIHRVKFSAFVSLSSGIPNELTGHEKHGGH
jgi:hypothetical protein